MRQKEKNSAKRNKTKETNKTKTKNLWSEDFGFLCTHVL